MGALSVRLFSWLHNAPFYKELHQSAIDLLPRGHGGLWLDVGCGPGVLTRLAAQHGYHAIGIDLDQEMVERARELSRGDAEQDYEFKQGNLLTLFSSSPNAGVVSGSSLLAVMPDRKAAMEALLRCVKPGGTLLLIETTEKMRFQNALTTYRQRGYGLHDLGFLLWGVARGGQSPANQFLKEFSFPGTVQSVQLLDGLVEAWLIGKLP